jgi:peptidyl-prolyl cis-trans isomerase D
MAVLQNIRNRAGVLVIIFVGVALFLFIIDPSTFNGLFNKPETNIAEVNGKEISIQEFNENLLVVQNFVMAAQQSSSLDNETELQLRDQVWQELLNKYLLSENMDEMGIGVSESELEDMLWGANIHPIIQQNFSDPNTGQMDTAYIQQFFESADLDDRFIIITDYLKDQILKDRELTKYSTLLAKGVYIPTEFAKEEFFNDNNKVDFAYVSLNVKSINDDEVELTEDDLLAYYEAHKYMYENEERMREIEYVEFPVVPNAEDSAATLKQMQELHELFVKSDNDSVFAEIHSDKKFLEPYYAQEEVPNGYGNQLFEERNVGFVSDIFTQDTSFMMFKLVDFVVIPDSVKARHILLSVDSLTSYQQGFNILDSLKKEVENGADFSELATQFSDDRGSRVKGGDLGWFKSGAMVEQFDKACFYGQVGTMPIVATQFGLHLISIDEHSEGVEKVKLAIVNKTIDASNNTYQKIYADASAFASEFNTAETFDKAVVDKALVKHIASEIKEVDREIRGLKDSREIIKWSFNHETGSISEVFEIPTENTFVVAKLTKVQEEGIADFEQVKEQIEPLALRDKKAQILMERLEKSMSGKSNLTEIASALETNVDTAKNISFNSFSIPRLGIEPKLISAAVNCKSSGIVGPIKGNNGIYAFHVINKVEAIEPENYDESKMKLTNNVKNRMARDLMDAVIKSADLKDNRSKFF